MMTPAFVGQEASPADARIREISLLIQRLGQAKGERRRQAEIVETRFIALFSKDSGEIFAWHEIRAQPLRIIFSWSTACTVNNKDSR